jgi:predicted SAM-dependent methyltransferase
MEGYLAERRRRARGTPSAKVAAFGRRLFPTSLRPAAKLAATRAIERQQRKRAVKLAEVDGIRQLHLGCGSTRIPGWINIDLFGTNADVFLDLRKPMPFGDASMDAIFHEHLLEHLPYSDALQFTRECARVLKPGGLMRMAMPDFRRYAESYLGGNGLIDAKRPDRPTRLLAFSEVFYDSGHCSMWDETTLRLLVTEAGFSGLAASQYGRSSLGDIDSLSREMESLYVEATR